MGSRARGRNPTARGGREGPPPRGARICERDLGAAGVLEGAAPLSLPVASQHHLVALHGRGIAHPADPAAPRNAKAAGIHCTLVAVAAGTQLVYDFAEGSREMRDLLGGKGANVAEMTRILGAERVPAGFTITTEACVAYMEADRTEPEGLDDQVDDALGRLEEMAGKRLGDPEDPLLVSVRSGARESMPGMLDTVLNLGLNDQAVEGLARSTGNERFAWDSYRRFVQMFGNVCRDVPGEKLEDAIKERKRAAGVKLDTELSVVRPQGARRRLQGAVPRADGRGVPSGSARCSSRSRSAPSSTRGWASGPSSTGGSTAYPTTGARRSTSSRWCSATRGRGLARAWLSRATRSPAHPSPPATSS